MNQRRFADDPVPPIITILVVIFLILTLLGLFVLTGGVAAVVLVIGLLALPLCSR